MYLIKRYSFHVILCSVLYTVFCFSAPASAQTFAQWKVQEKEVLDLVNLQRSHNGLSWLKANSKLQEAARLHSLDMGTNNYFSHNSDNGKTKFSARITAQGYDWNYAGENIAAGQHNARAVMYGTDELSLLSDFDKRRGNGGFASWSEVGKNWTDDDWDAWQVYRNHHGGWMGSAGHRDNILSQDFVDIGIGYAFVENSHYHRYWTQDFGRGDSNPEAIPSIPAAPSASDGTYPDHVQVNWNATGGVDIYLIVRCTDRGLDNCVEIYQGAARKIMDTTIADMVTYYYRLRGCNESGCSGYSSADSGYRDSSYVPLQGQPGFIPIIQLLLGKK